jgi:hypothetical protein
MHPRLDSRVRTTLASERGVTLIQVAIAIFVLTGFSAFVLDYGVMWLGRGQAQNAADAGAMAGIIARLSDETGPPVSGGYTELSAQRAVAGHEVVGEAPAVVVKWEPDGVGGGSADACPAGAPAGSKCVRVEVFRDATNGSTALPTYFGKLFGLNTQNVRATATAQLMTANWANCIKPWMVQDKFIDQFDIDGTGTNDVFDLGIDTYTQPGYRVPADITGIPMTLQAGDPTSSAAPGQYYRIDLTGGGASAFLDNISGCANVSPTTTMETLPGLGPAVDDETTPHIGEIVPLLLFSPEEWVTAHNSTGRSTLTIVNIIGFKVLSVSGRAVTGTIAAVAGQVVSGGPTAGGLGGFVQAPVLTR